VGEAVRAYSATEPAQLLHRGAEVAGFSLSGRAVVTFLLNYQRGVADTP